MPIHGETDGYFSIQTLGDSDFPHFADRFRSHFVYTNPETGGTFTVDTIGSFRDLHLVDNGDGTLTITNQFAGHQNVYDSDGNLVLTDRGLVREVVLIAHKGTIDPDDDDFIEQLSIEFFGPHGTEGRDFCDDFFEFTT